MRHHYIKYCVRSYARCGPLCKDVAAGANPCHPLSPTRLFGESPKEFLGYACGASKHQELSCYNARKCTQPCLFTETGRCDTCTHAFAWTSNCTCDIYVTSSRCVREIIYCLRWCDGICFPRVVAGANPFHRLSPTRLLGESLQELLGNTCGASKHQELSFHKSRWMMLWHVRSLLQYVSPQN